jgi:hypothetical protein
MEIEPEGVSWELGQKGLMEVRPQDKDKDKDEAKDKDKD